MSPLIPPDLRQLHLPSSEYSLHLWLLLPPTHCSGSRFLTTFCPFETIRDTGFNHISLAQQCQNGRDTLYVCFGCRHDPSPPFLLGSGKERVKNVSGWRLRNEKLINSALLWPYTSSLRSSGLPLRGQECDQPVEAKRWICCHFGYNSLYEL